MGRYLNVGIIQMNVTTDAVENLKYIEEKVEKLMAAYHRPELIVGVETISWLAPQRIPGPITEYFGNIAKKYGIYFIPGTLSEYSEELPEGYVYNTAPIFNPKGELVDKYRKMAPWAPAECFTVPGNRYVVFDMPEKNTKVGVEICYDSNFPEITRTLALMGAEVIVKLTMDPEELYELNRPIHFARALENQAYFVSINGVGMFEGINLYGKSTVIGPDGKVLWEAGNVPAIATVTLDLDLVTKYRKYGTMFLDHYLKHLKEFNIQYPFAGRLEEAPVYKNIGKAPKDVEEYEKFVREEGLGQIGIKAVPAELDIEGEKRAMDVFLEDRNRLK